MNFGLRMILALVFVTIVISCEKTHEDKPVGDYVIDTVLKGDISAGLIKFAVEQKGITRFNEYFKYNISINKISYTTNYLGKRIKVSGLVCYPKNIENPASILLVQNGLAYADIHAPTSFSLPGNFLGYEFLASAGYIVVLPDMIGFGDASDYIFPIYNAQYSISTVKDMLIAAEEYLTIKNIDFNSTLFMGGYSMGGYVSAIMQKAFESDPDFKYNIAANAIGAGGYDLLTLMNNSVSQDSFATPSHLALIFSSYNESYEWNKALTSYFSEDYASIIPDVISGKYTREEADSFLTPDLGKLLNPTFLKNLRNRTATDVIEALKENSINDWKPVSPIRLYHSENDERIPISDTRNTYENMIKNGSTSASLVKIDGEDHFDAVFNFMEKVLPWFDSLRVE